MKQLSQWGVAPGVTAEKEVAEEEVEEGGWRSCTSFLFSPRGGGGHGMHGKSLRCSIYSGHYGLQ